MNLSILLYITHQGTRPKFHLVRRTTHPTLYVGREGEPHGRHRREVFCESVHEACLMIEFAEVELHPGRENSMHYRLVSGSRCMSQIL
jgi:hypothetical protein